LVSKKCVITSRSAIKAELASMIAGIANTTMNDTTRLAQTNSGMRFSDMPVVRSLKIVTISCTATARPDTSVKVIICAQISALFFGANVRRVSGT
jgi:hypothetical protein